MSAGAGFTSDEQRLLAEAARAAVRRGLGVPTMMFLETVAPMNMVTSSMLTMLSPVWRTALPASRIDQVAKLLERRDAIPELIRIIDEQEDQRRSEQRAARDQRRARRRRWFGKRGDDAAAPAVTEAHERRGV